jgi:hypothetical protein
MIHSAELILLIKLILAHLLTDFVLQPGSWVKKRIEKKHKSGHLYLHAAITAIVAYIISGLFGSWWLPLIIFLSHLLIDLWKSHQPSTLRYFIIDQLLHIIILLWVWILALDKWHDIGIIWHKALNSTELLLVITAYLAIGWPLGILIGIATEKWRNEAAINSEGLAKAGMWIGFLERFLILTFILINQYTAIGFLIAAKSVLRFSDQEHTQKKTEYVLIGTLLSFSVSFATGLTVQYLLTLSA